MSYVVRVQKEIFVFIYFSKGYREIQNKQLALKKKSGSISAIFHLDVISATGNRLDSNIFHLYKGFDLIEKDEAS